MKRLLPTWASALLVAIAIVGALAMLARAALAAECPNKFGDQKEVSAGADNDEDAKTELAKLLKKALDDAAAECKDKTCTDTKTKCRPYRDQGQLQRRSCRSGRPEENVLAEISPWMLLP